MIDSTNLPNAGPRPVGARAARRRLLVFPGSAVATGGIVALATWPRLPDVMVTHWGAGGADGWMPRAWAVGLPLAMSLIALAWNLVVAYARPRSIRGTIDVAVIAGLFSWLGTTTLVASIWLAEAMGEAVVLIVGLPILAAVLVYRDARSRYVRSSDG
ncbi:DUF1648 domain-containing protein [Piscicoccus intestinalis]|uniref:DUF1648 domain-containing protein n=1 Tax=Piscicoccus intestinalis TaxID=746033 RepID=UPI000837F799|nr:DUF1648 domain-containing protein [Piscicoccus intestinalis]